MSIGLEVCEPEIECRHHVVIVRSVIGTRASSYDLQWPVDRGIWYVEVYLHPEGARQLNAFIRRSNGVGQPPDGMINVAYAPEGEDPIDIAVWFCSVRNATESLLS